MGRIDLRNNENEEKNRVEEGQYENNLQKYLPLTLRHSVAFNPSKYGKGKGMYTASSLAKHAGTTVRTIHYYDRIGILLPTEHTDTGYRLYDEAAAAKLKEILFYREVGFSLKDIEKLFEASLDEWQELLEIQVGKLKEEQQQMESQIRIIRNMQKKGRRAVSEYFERNQDEEERKCIAETVERK